MPKVPVQEIFSRGLVTSRPPHMLSSGELVRAGHTVYRENNPCLLRAPDHGLYCEDNLSALFPSGNVVGVCAVNFDKEEYPDQIVAKVGNDLVISNVTGLSGNTFEAITSPAKLRVQVGNIEYREGVSFTSGSNVIQVPAGQNWNSVAKIGRPVTNLYNTSSSTFVITALNYDAQNNVSSIVLNGAFDTGSNTLLFAPKCTIVKSDYVFYQDSVGFSGQVTDAAFTKEYSLTANLNSNSTYIVANGQTPTGDPLYGFLGACIGRNVAVTGHPGEYPILFIDPYRGPGNFPPATGGTYGYIYGIYLSNAGWGTTQGAHTVTLKPYKVNLTITAVDDPEVGGQVQSYKSCYFNWFTNTGEYEIVLNGGVGRTLLSSDTSIDSLSWDGTAFIWDGVNRPYRLSYQSRKHFHSSFDTRPVITYRPVGLLPVVEPPKVEVVSEGAWNAFLGNAHYWFLITEAYIPERAVNNTEDNFSATKDPIESAYVARNSILTPISNNNPFTNGETAYSSRTLIGQPIRGTITSYTSQSIRLTMPAPQNNGTDGFFSTHWNIYMAKGSNYTANTSSTTEPPSMNSFHRVLSTPILTREAGQIVLLRDSIEKYEPALRKIRDVKGRPRPYISKQHRTGDGEMRFISGAEVSENVRNAEVDFEFFDSGPAISPLGTAGTQTENKKVYGIEVHVENPICSEGDENYFWIEPRTKFQAGTKVLKLAKKTKETSVFRLQVFGGPGEMFALDGTNLDISTFAVRMGVDWTNGEKEFGFRCDLYRPNASDYTKTVWNDSDYGVEDPTWDGIQRKYEGEVILFNRTPWDALSPKVYNVKPRVRVFLYLTGTTINLNGPIYKTVVYEEAASGVTISDPAMMPPPICSIGDSFNGSFVVNDVSSPSFIRYSMPDRPEYFPTPYRLRLGTKRKGAVTAIKPFKGVLVVGMERCIKVVNYLPNETDTDFLRQVGRAVDEISNSHGIVGPNALTEFELPGVGSMLAYVSTIGLRVTDGATTKALNTDVLLKDYVHPDHWGKCILKAYPSQKWLVLYYVPKEASHGQLTRSLVFSFSEDHLKGSMTLELVNQPSLTGPLAATGPNDCFVLDATEAIIQSSPVVITTDGQFVYVEDSTEAVVKVKTATSNDNPALVNRVNAPDIKSRDIFPAGPTQDANISGIYILHETKGSHFIRTDGTSTKGSTTLSFTSPVGPHIPAIGERVIHGGWDNVVTVLQVVDSYNIIVSAPAVRTVTSDAVYDTGNIMVRINAGQLGEDMVPILTEYRSTTVGVNQTFLMDGTANRFSVEISKVENPNTGFLMDLNEELSIAGISYHAMSAGEAGLHVN